MEFSNSSVLFASYTNDWTSKINNHWTSEADATTPTSKLAHSLYMQIIINYRVLLVRINGL